jgi:PIN domain nuclease of toxin-antitoxin system
MAARLPMNVLLDSCALLALADGTLPLNAKNTLESAPRAHVSVVSPWELGIKVTNRKLTLKEPVETWFIGLVERYQLQQLALNVSTVCAAANLPLIHRDPFDRVLVATALRDRLTILTSDKTIPTYPGIKTLW